MIYVKRLEQDVEILKKEQRCRYAHITDNIIKLKIARVQKAKEVEINAVREKNDPGMTEQGRRGMEYNASFGRTRQLTHKTLLMKGGQDQ